MQRYIKPKMSLKALQELQRIVSSQGAIVCANFFKEHDTLSQSTFRCIMLYYIYLYLINLILNKYYSYN